MARNKNKYRNGSKPIVEMGDCKKTDPQHEGLHVKAGDCEDWTVSGALTSDEPETEMEPREQFKVWLEKHVNVIPLQAVQEMETLVDKFFPQE